VIGFKSGGKDIGAILIDVGGGVTNISVFKTSVSPCMIPYLSEETI